MSFEPSSRQRRLIDAVLILAAIALGFVVMGFVAALFASFGDVILQFFLAWLLSFALLPLINGLTRLVPRVPHVAAVIVVYVGIVLGLGAILVQASANLVASIGQLLADLPRLEQQLADFLGAWERRLAGLGFNVELSDQAPGMVANLQQLAGQLVGPLQSIAFASIGVFGSILIIVILSVYIAVDRSAIAAFLFRLVPPTFAEEARLLQVSVARSFGGFLRGQLVMGVLFGVITAIVNVVFGLQYAAVTTVAAGILHAVPFFGPFISWLPPVAVALLAQPDAVVPVVIIMGVGWLLTMNVVQPRLMADAVGIHPIVVLGSVIVGAKVAGIAGAIFGIPIAAVASAFFFHWFGHRREGGTVADRAAERLAAREGRSIRRPREPVPGVDADVPETTA